jgi:hypothetical protein
MYTYKGVIVIVSLPGWKVEVTLSRCESVDKLATPHFTTGPLFRRTDKGGKRALTPAF